MRVSVHIADVGARSLVRVMRGQPRPGEFEGLRSIDVAVAAPLRASSLPSPQPGRVAMLAFWDDDAAIDRFESSHPVASMLADGWSVRLEALRRWGSWPGLDESVPTDRATPHDGTAVVVTLARTRMSQLPRFLRTSEKAERAAVESPGLLWGTALARPPYFATVSVWDGTRSLSTYAYGRRDPRHAEAIEVDQGKPFHHLSAFIRFRPYRSTGLLGGKNPQPIALLADTATQ